MVHAWMGLRESQAIINSLSVGRGPMRASTQIVMLLVYFVAKMFWTYVQFCQTVFRIKFERKFQ